MADARRATLKDQTDISGARALIVEARFYESRVDSDWALELHCLHNLAATKELLGDDGSDEKEGAQRIRARQGAARFDRVHNDSVYPMAWDPTNLDVPGVDRTADSREHESECSVPAREQGTTSWSS